ncbi:MAG: acylneuraminate cytidylyltransferase [Anaerolineaceae bacterium]|nr:acylneuraminate cytidylyltransferase [Anaerolineaceae bacterium]
MVNKPEVLALIPARGGSKGIPRKNIRDFAGYPLIAYSIIAALQAETVTRVIVTTDDEEIAAISRQWGAEAPFLRPEEFSQDMTQDFPVIVHALNWLSENEGYSPDVVVWLRPTSPVRPLNCVDDAVGLLLDHPNADSVRGVVEAGQNPYKMWRIDEVSGVMKPLIGVDGVSEAYNAPRQILPRVFWQTGHIDAIRTKTILEKNSPTGEVILPLYIDPLYTVDIDQPSDWKDAERLVTENGLQVCDPASKRRKFPENVQLLVFDFDGVMTDNRVWVDQNGQETVAANRSDGMGIGILLESTNVGVMVISRESNPVVNARCKKLNIPVIQSVLDKASALRQIMGEKNIPPQNVIFMGNDTNDLPAFEVAGFSVAPADAHPVVLRSADLVLSMTGGHGAVRELCDKILSLKNSKY